MKNREITYIGNSSFKFIEELISNQEKNFKSQIRDKEIIINVVDEEFCFIKKFDTSKSDKTPIVKPQTETKFKNGNWYSFSETGQGKFLIIVEDAEKMICSGFDCKGNPFKSEWVYLGNRLTDHKMSKKVSKELLEAIDVGYSFGGVFEKTR